jgi:hypothetical protein
MQTDFTSSEFAPAGPRHLEMDVAVARVRAEWRSALLRRLRGSMDRRQKTFFELARQPDLDSLIAYAKQRSNSSYGTYASALVTLAQRFVAERNNAAAAELAIVALLLRPTAPRACEMLVPLLPDVWPASLAHLQAGCVRHYTNHHGAVPHFAAQVVMRFGAAATQGCA